MTTTVPTIFENGVFRPLEPVHLHEGQIVQVPIPEKENIPQHERIKALLAEWAANPDDTPVEWWEDFDKFMAENRFDLPERDLGLDQLCAT